MKIEVIRMWKRRILKRLVWSSWNILEAFCLCHTFHISIEHGEQEQHKYWTVKIVKHALMKHFDIQNMIYSTQQYSFNIISCAHVKPSFGVSHAEYVSVKDHWELQVIWIATFLSQKMWTHHEHSQHSYLVDKTVKTNHQPSTRQQNKHSRVYHVGMGNSLINRPKFDSRPTTPSM